MPAHKPAMEPAEKLWELLRRNPRFRRTAAKMVGWAQNVAANRDKGFVLLSRLEGRPGKPGNLIAAEALRWLAPDPWFVIEEKDEEKDGQKRVTRLGVGTTPDPEGKKGWRWFDRGPDGKGNPWRKANVTGLPHRWGPEIKTPGRIAGWRQYFDRRAFTMDTPWDDAPAGFKDRLRRHWAALPGMGVRVVRTRYFEAESPAVDEITVAGLARGIEYRRLARHLVFAVSKPRVAPDVDAILKRIRQALTLEVRRRDSELMGTTQYWATYQDLDARRQGDRTKTGEAIREYITKRHVLESLRWQQPHIGAALTRWCPDGVLAPEPPRRVARSDPARRRERAEWEQVEALVARQFTIANPKYRPDLKRCVDFMDTLVDATFPRFDVEALLQLPPH